MSDDKKLIEESPIPDSPVVPNQLDGDTVIQFRCHKDIDCFNACCRNIDIMMTPVSASFTAKTFVYKDSE